MPLAGSGLHPWLALPADVWALLRSRIAERVIWPLRARLAEQLADWALLCETQAALASVEPVRRLVEPFSPAVVAPDPTPLAPEPLALDRIRAVASVLGYPPEPVLIHAHFIAVALASALGTLEQRPPAWREAVATEIARAALWMPQDVDIAFMDMVAARLVGAESATAGDTPGHIVALRERLIGDGPDSIERPGGDVL